MFKWYELATMHTRAGHGGEWGVNGRCYRGGEILPFYVPRPVMPQIDEADMADFLAFALVHGADVRRTTFAPTDLRAHQRIDRIKAARMPVEVRTKPVFVSLDLFILDGNHRWALHMALHDQDVPAIQLNLEFEAAIALMFSFPKTYALETHPETN